MSRTARERLTDISDAVDGVRRAVQALEQVETENAVAKLIAAETSSPADRSS